jgi:hypothetical protein
MDFAAVVVKGDDSATVRAVEGNLNASEEEGPKEVKWRRGRGTRLYGRDREGR